MTSPSLRWPVAIKALHWSVVLAVIVVAPAGYLMSRTFGPSFKDAKVLELHLLMSQIHHTLGFLLLGAGLIWLVTRLRIARPPHESASVVERAAARAVHLALGMLLLLIPWSGWTALSALEDSAAYGKTHMWFFGFDRILPRIWTPLPATDPAGYGRFAGLHRWLLITAAVLLAVHLLSALWHHFARRDAVLRRMWPLG
jgi:cytochrome b561